MKSSIEVNFCKWSSSYEVHVSCTGTNYMVILFWDACDVIYPFEWQIQPIDDNNNLPSYMTIPLLTLLSDEEYFQKSIVWDFPVDIFLVYAIQKHVLEEVPKWKTDTCYSTTLEY